MNYLGAFLLAAALAAAVPAAAFESDVHFGLTQWLAIQAGFDEEAAATIATGNQRVDSGDMQYLEMTLVNACIANDERGAGLTGEHHYPSLAKIPSPPASRPVEPGSDAAKKTAIAMTKINPSQSQFMLFLLGEGLHELQDSWSHQGIADVPAPSSGIFSCDPARAWGHPKARGGWNSHKADLTMYWLADTVAMAQATYEVLKQYPPLAGVQRTAKPWESLGPLVEQFAKASTKAEKSEWFARQGISDVSFLEGITLKDGAKPFLLQWPGRKLPPLESPVSRQHGLDADALAFYNRFFEQWMATKDFTSLAAEFSAPKPGARNKQGANTSARAELVGRLKVWRIRDHGRVADIAHSLKPLTAQQRATLDAIGRDPNGYVAYGTVADAFFPFLPRTQTKDVSPLLPFFVKTWTEHDVVHAVAVAKFRHAPYDTVDVVAERDGGAWHVVSIGSTVDH